MAKLLKKVIKVKYQRKANMNHTFVGELLSVRKKSIVLDVEGKFISLGYKRIIGPVEVLEIKNKKLREEIKNRLHKIVFIEYDTDMALIRTIGKPVEAFEHHFDFQSSQKEDGDLDRIHYDRVVQLSEDINQTKEIIFINPKKNERD